MALSQDSNCTECRSSLRLSNLFVKGSADVAKTMQLLPQLTCHFCSNTNKPRTWPHRLQPKRPSCFCTCHKRSYSPTHSHTLH